MDRKGIEILLDVTATVGDVRRRGADAFDIPLQFAAVCISPSPSPNPYQVLTTLLFHFQILFLYSILPYTLSFFLSLFLHLTHAHIHHAQAHLFILSFYIFLYRSLSLYSVSKVAAANWEPMEEMKLTAGPWYMKVISLSLSLTHTHTHSQSLPFDNIFFSLSIKYC